LYGVLLFIVLRSVIEHIRDDKATQADVTELSNIQEGLEQEFAGYTPQMQEEVRGAKDQLVQHLTKLRTQLAAQLKLNRQQPMQPTNPRNTQQCQYNKPAAAAAAHCATSGSHARSSVLTSMSFLRLMHLRLCVCFSHDHGSGGSGIVGQSARGGSARRLASRR
jgi:hypothetical protein